MNWGRGWIWFAMMLGLGAASEHAWGQSGASCGVVTVKRDAVRDLQWAVVVDCEHPERPARLVPAVGKDVVPVRVVAAAVPVAVVKEIAPLVVRAGETVRVWSNDGVVKMDTTGVAQESGGVGKRIRVRMLRQGMESTEVERFVTGVVAGPGSVEMGR
jgi:Chaperone for flagella basal body P-ring formation